MDVTLADVISFPCPQVVWPAAVYGNVINWLQVQTAAAAAVADTIDVVLDDTPHITTQRKYLTEAAGTEPVVVKLEVVPPKFTNGPPGAVDDCH